MSRLRWSAVSTIFAGLGRNGVRKSISGVGSQVMQGFECRIVTSAFFWTQRTTKNFQKDIFCYLWNMIDVNATF